MPHPFSKRLFDIALAAPLFILSVPIIIIAGGLVLIANGWPVFYAQEREGFHGKPFKVRKLRTMKRGSETDFEKYLEQNPAVRTEWENRFKLEDDPRVIPVVGEFLRKSNIDELPQFWNVLRGEMSLVGPRPFPEYHLEKFAPEWRTLRGSVMPGITGLWQVTTEQEDNLVEQERMDREYLRQRSLPFDFKIIFLTAKKMLSAVVSKRKRRGKNSHFSVRGRIVKG